MNPSLASTALALSLALVATAQEPAAPSAPPPPLQPMQPIQPSGRPLFEDTCFDADLWRARLSQPDLDLRESAFEELIAAAHQCNAAHRVLATWAASSAEPQLAWTARMALRELRNNPFRVRWVPNQPGASSQALGREVPDAFQDLELHLRSIEDLLAGGFEGGGELSLHRLRQFSLPDVQGLHRDHRSYGIEVHPGGVRLRVIEIQNGQQRTQEYEAESLDALIEEHPELRDQVPGLGDMVLQPFGAGTRLEWSDSPIRLRVDPHGWRTQLEKGSRARTLVLGAEGPKVQVLGIECGRPSPEDVQICRLQPNCGVRIERIEPGTIADDLDLRRGDILIELNGTEICSDEQITELLAQRRPDQPIVVKIVDASGEARLKTWQPARTPGRQDDR